jgi:hypothetical protein
MNILSWETIEGRVLIREPGDRCRATLIVGTPFLRLFPLTEIGVFPGDYYNEPK